jgi:aryl sulfotransferase
MSRALPQVSHVYRNHHLDSTRWQAFVPRASDLVVSTAYKAGTTWTQQILCSLLHPAHDISQATAISPWIDARFMGGTTAELAAKLAALPDRRFVKSHLPLDGMPFHPEVRYIVVARDPRDVFMSLLNHYENYTDVAYAMVDAGERVGDPMPRYDGDPRALFHRWISRGWFPWESEGWPYWSNMHHTQTWWPHRDLPNVLLLHYNDMLADLDAAVRRIAAFAAIDVDEAAIAHTVEATTFANVKRRVEALGPGQDGGKAFFRGGPSAFFFKGQNGRWRTLLGDEELALYAAAKRRVLDPDCARWLENGGPAGPA